MSYGVPGLFDRPEDVPVYGFGSYHHRTEFTENVRNLFRYTLRLAHTGEWLSILLLFVTLGIAAYSVQQAKWVSSQLPLLVVLLFSVFITALLIKISLPKKAKLIIAPILLLLMLYWQAVQLADGQSVFRVLASSPNENTIHFAIFLLFVTWVSGAVSTWLMLLKDNAWLPAGIGAAIILVNLSNLSSDYFIILPVYLGIALIMIGVTRFSSSRHDLLKNGGYLTKRTAMLLTVSVLIFSLFAAFASWFIPVKPIEQVGFDADSQLMADMQKNALNVFASVPSKWRTIRYTDQKTLSFDAPLDNRAAIIFIVSSPQPSYWRIQRYSQYNEKGWSGLPEQLGATLEAGARAESETLLAGRREITYTIETHAKADVLLLAGEFISADVPVRLSTPTQYPSDVTSVIATHLIQPHQTYTATVSVNIANGGQLSGAGTDYPEWITNNYLQLPDNLPRRIGDLALAITDNVNSPYEKAAAVQKYLNGYKYNPDVKSPSRLGDETDVFLFQQKEGVCTDFASAMVVMLRSIGIPSRLVTGYAPGEFDESTGTFIIRGRDYHAWPEVYFPGYGWIEFEPTPGSVVDLGITSGNTYNPNYYELFPPYPIDSGSITIPNISPGNTAAKRPNYIFPVIIILLFAFAVGSIIWIFANRAYRNLRLSGDAVTVYDKMCRLASSSGASPFISETPLEYCRRLAAMVPVGAEPIWNIAVLYTQSRFSPKKDLPDSDLVRLQKAWVELYPLLFKRRLPWSRQ